MTWFQWAHGGKVQATTCKPGTCNQKIRGKVYWAWDRFLGAWVHYTAPAWGQERIATLG